VKLQNFAGWGFAGLPSYLGNRWRNSDQNSTGPIRTIAYLSLILISAKTALWSETNLPSHLSEIVPQLALWVRKTIRRFTA